MYGSCLAAGRTDVTTNMHDHIIIMSAVNTDTLPITIAQLMTVRNLSSSSGAIYAGTIVIRY